MLVNTLKDVLGVFFTRKILFDSNIFQRFHYRFSVAVLLIFVVVLIFNQNFGSHIYCIAGKITIQNIIDQYCYWSSSFILVRGNERNIYDGVGPYSNEEIKVIAYYQWVQLFLTFQCSFFYVGRVFWKTFEKNRLHKMLQLIRGEMELYRRSEDKIFSKHIDSNLCYSSISQDLSEIFKKLSLKVKLLKVLVLNRDRGCYFILSEVVNFSVIICQIYLTDLFLQGQFLLLGPLCFKNYNDNLLNFIFPKITKCNFENIGPSGTRERSDAICFLPQNILNEKIFIFLWFWYAITFCMTVIGLLNHLFKFFFFKHFKYNELIRRILEFGEDSKKVLNFLTYSDFIYLTHLLDSCDVDQIDVLLNILRLGITECRTIDRETEIMRNVMYNM